MKNTWAKNIILVMSGGSGTRFGADCPKQYCRMSGKLVIDYVMDSCRKTNSVDEIIAVTSNEYQDFVAERYHIPVVVGGATRPESVAAGIKYIYENYCCEKLIITNAVCPLATSSQYEKYFQYLNEYDYVLTTWKLAPALHCYDGTRVDRDDFFNVMEPDAYRFSELYRSYDFVNLKKYIFHNMPEDAKGFYCMDYPYTMKVTYPFDIKLLEVLYEDIVINPDKESTIQTVNAYLSSGSNYNYASWITSVQTIMREELVPKYSITSYIMNAQTEANIVYEAESLKYGSIIVKFTPSNFFFQKELTYYKMASKKIMAHLIDCDMDYHVLIIETIKPGNQVRFDTNNLELRSFYDEVNKSLIPIEEVENNSVLPTVMSEFEEYVAAADRHTYKRNLRKILEKKARRVYKEYFGEAQLYLLHRDLHKRNILKCGDGIRAIDPRCAIGPREFEYVIQFIIEIRDKQNDTVKCFNEMFDYFKRYVDEESYMAALFIFFVYKANDYVFQKHDNYSLAGWCIESIGKIFFHNKKDMEDKNTMPFCLKKRN